MLFNLCLMSVFHSSPTWPGLHAVHTQTHTRAGVRSVRGVGWMQSASLLLTVCCLAGTGPIHSHAATTACQLPELAGERHTLSLVLTSDLQQTHTCRSSNIFKRHVNVIKHLNTLQVRCSGKLSSHTCSLSLRMNFPGPFHLLCAWNTHS